MTTSYLEDILEQPAALQRTLDGLRKSKPLASFAQDLKRGKYQRIVLTGMGSSYFVLHPLLLRLIAQGFYVQAIETSELIYHAPILIEPRTLIVAVSQSGESVEMIRMMELAKNKATVIGVTNSPESTLARQAAAIVLTQAGKETSVSCKTYTTILAALGWLGDQLSNGKSELQFPQLADAPDQVAKYLKDQQRHVEQLIQRLQGINFLILTGRGNSLAAVGDGGLIIKESARFPTEGMSSAAFRHGPLEMVSPNVFVLVYAGSGETTDLNIKLAKDIVEAGGRAGLVSEGYNENPFDLPPSFPASLPILEILPAQMISLALAAMQGFEPGRFQRIGKITKTE